MSRPITEYQLLTPTSETYLRSIILFGTNTASYKFALGLSILNVAEQGKSIIKLEDLAPIYIQHLCQHIKEFPKQTTSPSSSFLKGCSDYCSGHIDHDQLIKMTLSQGFRYVISAFHNVNQNVLPIAFYEHDKKNQALVLTDQLLGLQQNGLIPDLRSEFDARWRLVETAWSQNISTNLLEVVYDGHENIICQTEKNRRKSVTSARHVANGYQKGHCFYCGREISIQPGHPLLCDVDHFIPHMFQDFLGVNLDGIWNLVLSCKDCNRGVDSKHARLPTINYLDTLFRRNEYFIDSHLPIREQLIRITGKTKEARRNFLWKQYSLATALSPHTWSPRYVNNPGLL